MPLRRHSPGPAKDGRPCHGGGIGIGILRIAAAVLEVPLLTLLVFLLLLLLVLESTMLCDKAHTAAVAAAVMAEASFSPPLWRCCLRCRRRCRNCAQSRC